MRASALGYGQRDWDHPPKPDMLKQFMASDKTQRIINNTKDKALIRYAMEEAFEAGRKSK